MDYENGESVIDHHGFVILDQAKPQAVFDIHGLIFTEAAISRYFLAFHKGIFMVDEIRQRNRCSRSHFEQM